MTHPCASHLDTCDHCAICEAGVCCATVSAEQRAQLGAADKQAEQFRQAVMAEASRTFTLADLLCIETERQVLGAPLHEVLKPGLPVAAQANTTPDSRKEAIRVVAARPTG